VLLTTKQSYELLVKHDSYITEVCDWCGKGIGPVRYTRKDDPGVRCSRECRDGKQAHAPGTCKGCGAKLPESKRRGAAFCDDACKQAAHRSRADRREVQDLELSVTKPSIYAGFRSLSSPGSYPHSRKPENGLIADKFAEGVQH
jgi:hypothetical protein